MCTEDSPSGLWRTLGKRVGCKPSGVRIPHPPPPDPGTASGSGVFVAFTWNFVVFVSKVCVGPMGCIPPNSPRVSLDRGKIGELSTKLVRQPVGCLPVVGSAGVSGAVCALWGRAAVCAGGRWPAREPSAPRASLGASSRSPARPRHRPPALRPGAPHQRRLQCGVCPGASSRSPARPRHRPPAPQPV